MTVLKRYCLFICGIFFMALGIALIIQSFLGTSPISSVPYILSLRYPITLGGFTFIVNMLFIIGQIFILRRQFQYIQFLQIPMTLIFSCFIDLAMLLFSLIQPENYLFKLLLLFIGCALLGLGVTLQVIGNVVMMSGEGLVNAIAMQWKFNFGYTKIAFDVSLVIIALTLSLIYFGEIHGIREGTVISAFLVGSMVRVYLPRLSYPDEHGNLIFCLPFFKKRLNVK